MTQTEAAVNNKEVQNLNTHTAGESEYVLQMKNISKSFPGVKAEVLVHELEKNGQLAVERQL